MKDLKLIESTGIIKIYETDKGEKIINARELHEGLESKQEFSNWIKSRIEEVDALENVDYSTFDNFIKREGTNLGNKRKEYVLKIDIAKEIAMLERNDQGKKYRRYFIEIEKKYKQSKIDVSQLSPELQMFKQIFDSVAIVQLQQRQIQDQISATAEQVTTIKETIVQTTDDWRKGINRMLNAIGKATGNFKTYRSLSYELLDQRAGSRLSVRLGNVRDRALADGQSKTKVEAMNYLDVIEQDKRLKEIYTSIVKELYIKYVS